MCFFRSIFIEVFIAFLSHTSAVPTEPVINQTVDVSTATDCLVPPVGLSTLLNTFTLSAVTDDDPIPWTVIFAEVRNEYGYQPFITREVIPEPTFEPAFSFQNGKLTVGPKSDNLTAYFRDSSLVEPPVLDPLYFDNVEHEGKFYATNNCDANGTTYLELRTFYRNDYPVPVLFNHRLIIITNIWSANTGFFLRIALVVSTIEEGAKVYGKPYPSEGGIIKEIYHFFHEINPSNLYRARFCRPLEDQSF